MSRLDKKTLEAAYRRRAGMIGTLHYCICGFPIVDYETSSRHAETCPAHIVLVARNDDRAHELVVDPYGAMCRICGCVDGDCANCIRRTGIACSWVEPDLCSACVPVAEQLGELPLATIERWRDAQQKRGGV